VVGGEKQEGSIYYPELKRTTVPPVAMVLWYDVPLVGVSGELQALPVGLHLYGIGIK
jgi:hypothetical protein